MKYADCIKDFKDAQTTDFDNREMVREADLFLNKRDGQWEPDVIAKFNNKPKYTFDECNPIIDSIMGELDETEYSVEVAPVSDGATKETAEYFGGIIRRIENISSARFIYDQCARIMVGTGFSAWRIITDYRDCDSFQQDLMLRQIYNAQDSVWFDPGAMAPDMSDSKEAWVLTSMTKKRYDEKYPEGSGFSVPTDLRNQAYSYKKPDEVVVGEYLYIKEKMRTLVRMTNGMIFEENEDFMRVKDELLAQGIEVNGTRKRSYNQVYQKKFDGKDYITDAQETVFNWIPIIPVYGNFKISENKVLYWGIVEKLMDAQRIINYSESRKIEEGALAPRGKVWMSKEQASSADVKATLRTLNTNSDPVQFYDSIPDQQPPQYMGAPQSNPGLVETSQSARAHIERTSSSYQEDRGTAPAHRSGVAIDKLQFKSDNPKRKWVKSMALALTHTYRIFLKAIPKVYDTQQEMLIFNKDGSSDTITIKQKIVDEATGEVVELNDLSKGNYDVTAVPGPSFQSKQQETVAAITGIAQVDPSIVQMGGDVLLSNINAPGINDIAERKRFQMVVQGVIPDNQLTDDEKSLVEQIRGEEDLSPIDRANLMVAQAQLEETQGKNQERTIKLSLDQQKLQLEQLKLQMEKDKADRQANREAMTMLLEQGKMQAETLKIIREAIGADGVIVPKAMLSYQEQADNVLDAVRKQ